MEPESSQGRFGPIRPLPDAGLLASRNVNGEALDLLRVFPHIPSRRLISSPASLMRMTAAAAQRPVAQRGAIGVKERSTPPLVQ